MVKLFSNVFLSLLEFEPWSSKFKLTLLTTKLCPWVTLVMAMDWIVLRVSMINHVYIFNLQNGKFNLEASNYRLIFRGRRSTFFLLFTSYICCCRPCVPKSIWVVLASVVDLSYRSPTHVLVLWLNCLHRSTLLCLRSSIPECIIKDDVHWPTDKNEFSYVRELKRLWTTYALTY